MPSAVVIGTGKMGKLIEQTLFAHGFEVLGAFGHENINQLNTVEQTPDVVVDFSSVAALRLLSVLYVIAGAHLFLALRVSRQSSFQSLSSWGRACR